MGEVLFVDILGKGTAVGSLVSQFLKHWGVMSYQYRSGVKTEGVVKLAGHQGLWRTLEDVYQMEAKKPLN